MWLHRMGNESRAAFLAYLTRWSGRWDQEATPQTNSSAMSFLFPKCSRALSSLAKAEPTSKNHAYQQYRLGGSACFATHASPVERLHGWFSCLQTEAS